MENKPVFENNTFESNFNSMLKSKIDDVPERIQELKEMVEDVILDFKFNKDPAKTYKLALRLDSQVNLLFDNLKGYKLDENDIHNLTEVCRKINEDPFLEEIREKGANPQIIEEKSYSGPTHKVKANALPNEPVVLVEQTITEKTMAQSPEKTGVQQRSPTSEDKQAINFVTNNEIILTIDNEEEKQFEKEKGNKVFSPESFRSPVKQNNTPEKDKEALLKSQKKEYIEKIRKEFVHLITKMAEEYEEHRIEDAWEYKNAALELAVSNSSEVELQGLFRSHFDQHEIAMKEIGTWNQEVKKVLSELQDDENYTVERGKKVYKLSYKSRADGKVIIKMEGMLEIPLFNILTLMYEADGFHHWVPFCADGKLVKPLHRAAHSYWLRYSMPFLTDRECYCYGLGVDRLHRNGSILLISRKIHDNPDFCEQFDIKLPDKTKYVKMDIDVAIEIIPISRQKIQIKVVTTVDPNVKHTPPAILSWISRKASQNLFDKLIKKARDLKGTLWEKRIQERREFYGWLEAKVNKFLDEHKLD